MTTPATSETEPVPPSEEEMGTHLSRLVKPFILAAPLMVVTLLPAALYGQRSRDVAGQADRALVESLTPTGDGSAITLDSEALCEPSAAATLTTTFAQIDLGGDNHKSSVSGLGFDNVTIDLEGRVDEPSGTDKDNITIHMERVEGGWCVADVETLVAGRT